MRQLSLLIMLAVILHCGLAWAQPAPPKYTPPATPPAEGVWRFDFGTESSPVQDRWYGVWPAVAYEAARGYGFEGKGYRKAFDQNRRVQGDTLILDDVTRDGIYGTGVFRLDLPDGQYTVVALTGEETRDGTNRPPCHARPYTITANGVTVYEQTGTLQEFYGPDGKYFHNYRHDWAPDTNLYQTYVSQWIPWATASVTVAGGALRVETSIYGPLNALFVFPLGSEAGKQAVTECQNRQEQAFNQQFPYVPEPVEHALPPLTAEVQQAGAVMYVRDDALRLRPGTRPVARDLGRPLRLFAAQGDRQAGVVAVTPLRDIQGPVRLVASDLKGPGGATLPASALDLRYLRYTEYPTNGGYYVAPFYLTPWLPEKLEKDITRGFWVDLFTPEEARPGLYEGKLTLSGPGLNASLPLQVRVLPLKLPQAKLRAGVYASNLDSTTFRTFAMSPEGDKLTPELHRQVWRTRMQFLADQGFTGLYDSLPWHPVDYKDGVVTPTAAWEKWKIFFELAKSFPQFRDEVFSYYLAGPQLYPTCPHWLDRTKIKGLDLDQITFSDEAIAEMTAVTKWLYQQVKANDWPQLAFYVQDELGNDGAKGARYGRELLKALNKVKAQVPGGFTTIISTLGIADAREYMNLLDITMPNSGFPITTETLKELRDSGSKLALYNCGANRFSFGFYPWRVGALLRAQWSFTYGGDVSDPYGAIPAGAPVSCDCKYTPDWQVLPSVGMLLQREGVSDYRYVQLLEERLAAADRAGRGNTPASRAGRKVLADLRQAIKETYLDPDNSWDTSTMDYWRWEVAKAALAL